MYLLYRLILFTAHSKIIIEKKAAFIEKIKINLLASNTEIKMQNVDSYIHPAKNTHAIENKSHLRH